MTWTVRCNADFKFTAALLPHASPTWGFVVEEAARQACSAASAWGLACMPRLLVVHVQISSCLIVTS